MILWLKLAWRESLNNWRFSLFFMINLALGMVGFIMLDSFKASLDAHLERNSKAILTADLNISARRPLKPNEHTIIAQILGNERRESQQVSFFSMVAGGGNSRLVQVLAIDGAYPLEGQIRLGTQGIVKGPQAQAQLEAEGGAWVYPDLLIALGLKLGDSLKIGEARFIIRDTVLEDPANAMAMTGLAPRIYIGLSHFAATKLHQQGSRLSYNHFYQLPLGLDLDTLAQTLDQQLNANYQGSEEIDVQTHRNASEQLARMLNYLNDYLGLVALIALFLAGLGAAYLFRGFLENRFKEIAILMSLGATRSATYAGLLLQILLLGGGASLLAFGVSLTALPLLPALLQELLPAGFYPEITWTSLVLAGLMGTLGSIFFCLPALTRIAHLQPLMLFHENIRQTRPTLGQRLNNAWSYLPGLLAYWLLAISQSHSLVVGTVFIGIFLGSLLILQGIAWLGLGLASRIHVQKIVIKIALRNLYRNRFAAISSFVAMGLGALLINLIPQIQKGLEEEISRPEGVKVPNFFLFDIQPEQLEGLQSYLQQAQYPMTHLSPMIRSRLEQVNGQPFERKQNETAHTREAQTEQRFRNRGFNLTYREGLSESEVLIAGTAFSGIYTEGSGKLPEISLEQRFAERLGLRLGDILNFDIQGVPIEGQVVSLRKVKWNSFQPNFFIVFQPGALENAPATFLAAIGNVPEAQKLGLQNSIVQQFPNISMLDVSRVVSRVLDIGQQMTLAIRAMAYLSILAGLVVLFSIARQEVESRLWEINLLKVLGARLEDVRAMVQIEFGLLGLVAAIFGVGLSLLTSLVIARFFFESLWSLAWSTTLGSIALISALSVITATIATYQVLRQKPLELLKTT